MMDHFYVLDDKRQPHSATTEEWGEFWINPNNRRVAFDEVGDFQISTVFLGIDHSYGNGPPVLFETMIFDGDNFLDYQERCATWEQAEQMHQQAIAWVKAR